ncbi:MAG: O-antigen ligase family protein [Steroidobacteraceae bacterium]
MNLAANALPSDSERERLSAVEYGYWAFLAVAVGRVNQLIPGLSSLPLAKLAIAVTAIAYLTQRRSLPALSADGRRLMRTGLWMAGLAVLLTPISIWRSASLNFVLFELPPLLVGTAVACSMRRSWKSLRGTLRVLLLCGFVLGALAALHYSHGRADDTNTMYDPNDLAYVLVTVIPLGLGFITLAQSRLRKVLYGLVTATSLVAMLLTQSRGGLLGLVIVLMLVVFLPLGVAGPHNSRKRVRNLRAVFTVGLLVACTGAVIWDQLPPSAQARYLTLLHPNQDYNTNPNNKNGRFGVWSQGLRAFEAWPIGYGPQTFRFVDSRFGGDYRAPHNSYLQALVELGPLGLYFLIRMYLLTLRVLRQTRSAALAWPKPPRERVERAVLSRALLYGVVGNMVSGFFLSDAYSSLPWFIFGLAAAMSTPPIGKPLEPTPSPRDSGSRVPRSAPGNPSAATLSGTGFLTERIPADRTR